MVEDAKPVEDLGLSAQPELNGFFEEPGEKTKEPK